MVIAKLRVGLEVYASPGIWENKRLPGKTILHRVVNVALNALGLAFELLGHKLPYSSLLNLHGRISVL